MIAPVVASTSHPACANAVSIPRDPHAVGEFEHLLQSPIEMSRAKSQTQYYNTLIISDANVLT